MSLTQKQKALFGSTLKDLGFIQLHNEGENVFFRTCPENEDKTTTICITDFGVGIMTREQRVSGKILEYPDDGQLEEIIDEVKNTIDLYEKQ